MPKIANCSGVIHRHCAAAFNFEADCSGNSSLNSFITMVYPNSCLSANVDRLSSKALLASYSCEDSSLQWRCFQGGGQRACRYQRIIRVHVSCSMSNLQQLVCLGGES